MKYIKRQPIPLHSKVSCNKITYAVVTSTDVAGWTKEVRNGRGAAVPEKETVIVKKGAWRYGLTEAKLKPVIAPFKLL